MIPIHPHFGAVRFVLERKWSSPSAEGVFLSAQFYPVKPYAATITVEDYEAEKQIWGPKGECWGESVYAAFRTPPDGYSAHMRYQFGVWNALKLILENNQRIPDNFRDFLETEIARYDENEAQSSFRGVHPGDTVTTIPRDLASQNKLGTELQFQTEPFPDDSYISLNGSKVGHLFKLWHRLKTRLLRLR